MCPWFENLYFALFLSISFKFEYAPGLQNYRVCDQISYIKHMVTKYEPKLYIIAPFENGAIYEQHFHRFEMFGSNR